jgi:hypothetical protein
MGTFAASWGVIGVVLLVGSATYRLSFPALQTFSYPLHWYHWGALAANTVFMTYSEGYRGFHCGFSPRVAVRARYLRQHPNLLRAFLAPLFCMGYFHAVPRRKIAAYSFAAGIMVLVVMVRSLPQPWRGIIDVGVVLGLVLGLMSLAFFTLLAFTAENFDHPSDVPGSISPPNPGQVRSSRASRRI